MSRSQGLSATDSLLAAFRSAGHRLEALEAIPPPSTRRKSVTELELDRWARETVFQQKRPETAEEDPLRCSFAVENSQKEAQKEGTEAQEEGGCP